MIEAKYIVDIMSAVVDLVRAAYDVDNLEPFFMYGHPTEIRNTLLEKEKNSTLKFQKYPLIALYQDFEERRGENMVIDATVSLNMLIATTTKPEYKSADRYIATFKTVLYPIYNILMEKLVSSGYFRNLSCGLVSHTKIDRVYWGKKGLYGNEGNQFTDFIDAIEIQNLDLEILTKKQC